MLPSPNLCSLRNVQCALCLVAGLTHNIQAEEILGTQIATVSLANPDPGTRFFPSSASARIHGQR